MNQNNMTIGVIGGSGLDDPQIMTESEQIEIDTPFGKPSSTLTKGVIAGKQVVILSRHGKKHNLQPTFVPYRANIWALKELGCDCIFAATACGSLQEVMKPGELVFIDQFIDFTKQRKSTFFDEDVVHTAMADPFDKNLRKLLVQSAIDLELDYHDRGTMITIEGPRFSSRAESIMFQRLGADLINMSTSPEVALANELKIPYQSIAMVTDYDCWRENEESVTFELVMKRMAENSSKVIQLLQRAITKIGDDD